MFAILILGGSKKALLWTLVISNIARPYTYMHARIKLKDAQKVASF